MTTVQSNMEALPCGALFLLKNVFKYKKLPKCKKYGTVFCMWKGIFFGIFLLIVLGASYLGSSMLMRQVRADRAQVRGNVFVQKLYAEYTIAGQSCQGEDTDGDNYVSCDYRLKNPAGEERVIHLQCPTIWKSLIGNSCKESRLVLPQ
jgi:hypothetical protein